MMRYYFLMRSPMPGAMPREGLTEVGFDEGQAPSGHFYWGWAEYNRELTAEEVSHYDLEKEGGQGGI